MYNGFETLEELAIKCDKSARLRAGAQQIEEIKRQFRQDANRARYESRNARDADAEIRILERDARKKLADVYADMAPLAQNDPELGDALHYAVYDLQHEGSLSRLAGRL